MPLVRYEIRNEYSLASSELYKKAAKDDPEGLLEGVAMAGLVGIVRQLGDLAEFATEVFHDLHEEVMATAARGHSLLIRVQQLEAELPGIEKCLFSDTNQIQCSYASEWHASIRNDQNHLTQGDLPWFIRNSYEECRGPPRLFLLDKFDIAGDGACLKRYTDPSFFKMEWANSELMKAEREQQDRKARRMKRKGRRRRNGEIDEAIHASQVHSRRYSSLEEDNGAGMLVSYIDNTEPQLGNEDDDPTMHKVAVNDHLSADSSKETFTYDGDILQPDVDTYKWNGEVCRENPGLGPLKISALDRWAEEGMPGKFVQADHTVDLKGKEEGETQHKLVQSVGDDVASDAEQFVDALATMESEVETDTESRVKMDVDSDFNSEPTEGERHVSLNDPFSKNNVVYEETFNADKYLPIQPPDESSAPFTKSGHVWSPASSANAVSNSSLDNEETSSSIDENDVSPPTGKHDFAPPFDENNSFPISEYHLEAGNVDHLSETPPHSERDDHKDMQSQDLAASFHVLPDPAIPLVSRDENGNSGDLGSLSLLEQANAGEIFTEGAGGFPEKSNVSDELENGLAKSPVEFSSHSMVESTIALLLKVNTESSKSQEDSVDTDDELDGMQVSSISTSSSPSTVSTPHRSLLATTEFHMDSEGEPNSPLSSQFHMVSEVEPDSPFSSKSSIESSPKSPIFSVLHSPISPVKLKPIFSPSSEAQIQSLHSELLAPSSPTLSPEFITEFTTELEELPPPPPLPPLEWRIVRPRQNSLPSVAKAIEPPPPPALPIPPMAIEPPPPPALPVPPMAIEPPPPPALPVPPIRPDRVSQDPIPPVPPIRPGRISQDPIPPVPPAVRPEKGLQDPVPFVAPLKLERRDSLIEAIAFHGKGMLKKVTQQNRSPRTKPLDDREVLLEQIRTRSFNLRHTVVEKHEAPRPMTNINVAAILEKANAIRQAFAGSDEDEEDDDWSDT